MNDEYISYEDFQRNAEMNMYNNCSCESNATRAEMIKKIKELKFSIIELSLYLDTHPNDRKALSMHKDYCNKYNKLADQYQKMYGPLSIMYPCNKWRWLEEPWPWERGNF